MSNVRIRYEHREIIVNIRDRVFFFFFGCFSSFLFLTYTCKIVFYVSKRIDFLFFPLFP